MDHLKVYSTTAYENGFTVMVYTETSNVNTIKATFMLAIHMQLINM